MPLGQPLAQDGRESPLVCWSLPGLMARYYDSRQYSLESKEIEKGSSSSMLSEWTHQGHSFGR